MEKIFKITLTKISLLAHKVPYAPFAQALILNSQDKGSLYYQ